MKLKVGDRIYCESYGSIVSIHIIDKTTEKFALSKRMKFKIDYDKDGSIDIPGRTAYNRSSYSIETPKLKLRLKEQNMRRKIFNAVTQDEKCYTNLPFESLQKIHDILFK